MNEWIKEWLNKWMTDWWLVLMNETTNEWMHELKEWRNDRIGGMNKKTVDNE